MCDKFMVPNLIRLQNGHSYRHLAYIFMFLNFKNMSFDIKIIPLLKLEIICLTLKLKIICLIKFNIAKLITNF